MHADTPAGQSRPRPWLLVALGVAVVALVANMVWRDGAASTTLPASNQSARRASGQQPLETIDPAQLEVRLEALEVERPAPGEAERNPFRFQPRAAPPAPRAFTAPPSTFEAVAPVPAGPPPPPPIPLKFIGIVDRGDIRIAALSDCKAATFASREGEIVDGRYRLVKIGLESVTLEHLDGSGRQTIRLTGECPPR